MKFENTKVSNFEGAFRGLRNPKNSWHLSDSYFGLYEKDTMVKDKLVASKWCEGATEFLDYYIAKLQKNGILNEQDGIVEGAFIGPKDMALAQKLIAAGAEHRKFLRQIFVSVDITAPLYWWKEMDTYKVATVANSTSTMHKLAETPITLDCFETDDFNSELVYYELPKFVGEAKNDAGMLADFIIEQLEFLRHKYLETKDVRYWKELIRWLPEGWLQKRTWTANYETIRAICSKGQRRNHKLTEWSESFIEWARTLPYAQYLIFDDENKKF